MPILMLEKKRDLLDKKCAELDIRATKVSEVWKKMSNITLIRMKTLDTHTKSNRIKEITKALKKLENEKATGPGGTPIALVNSTSNQLIEKTTYLFSRWLIIGDSISEKWRIATLAQFIKMDSKRYAEIRGQEMR